MYAVAGSREEFRGKPIAAIYLESEQSSLQQHSSIRILLNAVRSGFPLIYGVCLQMGMTSPITVARTLV